MNQPMGLESLDAASNPISPTGRAMMPSIHNMSLQDIQQQLAQAQQTGVPLNPTLARMMVRAKELEQSQPPKSPPSTTVAQDIEQALGTQQGVAALPVNGQMYQPQNMAGGGIVAFAGGDFVGPPHPASMVDPIGNPLGAEAGARAATAEDILAELTPQQRAAYNATPKSGKMAFLKRVMSRKGLASLGSKALPLYGGAVGITAVGEGFDAFNGITQGTNKSVPTEKFYEYFGQDQPEYFNEDGTPSISAPFRDMSVRLPGEAIRVASLGFAGPQADEAPAQEPMPQEGAVAEGDDADLSAYMRKLAENGKLGGASVGYEGMSPFDVRGYYAPYFKAVEQQKAGIGLDQTSEQGEIDKAKAQREQYGIGNALAERKAKTAEDVARLPVEARRDAWLDAAKGFFKMAEAGGRNASFFGAAAEGANEGLTAHTESLKRHEAKAEALGEREFQLSQMDEQLKSGDIAKGTAKYDQLKAQRDALDTELRKGYLSMGEKQIDVAMEAAKVKAQVAIAGLGRDAKDDILRTLSEGYRAILADPTLDPKRQKVLLTTLLSRVEEWVRASSPQVIVNGDKSAAMTNMLPGMWAQAPAAAEGWGQPRVKQ